MATKKPKNWTEQRTAILAEIRNDEPDRDWSVREVAEAMQKHELVKRFQPNYSKSTAHRDIALVEQNLVKKRDELAESYIFHQLETTDNILEDLLDEYESIAEYEFEEKERFIKTKVALAKTILAVQKRQASILPIDMPKKINIESNHRVDIEHFYQIAQKVDTLILDDPTIIDGEYDS